MASFMLRTSSRAGLPSRIVQRAPRLHRNLTRPGHSHAPASVASIASPTNIKKILTGSTILAAGLWLSTEDAVLDDGSQHSALRQTRGAVSLAEFRQLVTMLISMQVDRLYGMPCAVKNITNLNNPLAHLLGDIGLEPPILQCTVSSSRTGKVAKQRQRLCCQSMREPKEGNGSR